MNITSVNKLWSKQSAVGAEVETSELLYALVRLAKPEVVLECGCAHGDTSQLIGQALKSNGKGILHTCDIEESCVMQTRERCKDLPVNVYQQTGESLIESLSEIDFAFIDSGWVAVRCAEVRAAFPKLKDGAILTIHDVCQNYNLAYQEAFALFGKHGLVIDTPYGLGIFQKGEPQFTHLGVMVDLK